MVVFDDGWKCGNYHNFMLEDCKEQHGLRKLKEIDEELKLRLAFEGAVNKFHEYIRSDHHKERDCHFYIYSQADIYSYGKYREDKLRYRLLHHGYLMGEIDEEFNDIKNLYHFAIEKINEYIAHDTLQENW